MLDGFGAFHCDGMGSFSFDLHGAAQEFPGDCEEAHRPELSTKLLEERMLAIQ